MTNVSDPMAAYAIGTSVAVTGGCGFVGARVVGKLASAGCHVLVIDDMSSGSVANLPVETADRVHVAQADICDAAAMRAALAEHRPEIVIHLAAVHFIPACERDPAKAIRTNVEGTQTVLDACSACPSVTSIVVASSGAVYSPSDEAHTEESPVGPTDIYGHTKLWCEQLAALFHARTGIGMGVARLFNVVGPRETSPHLIPAIIAQLEVGDTLELGNLATRRDYVFVDDVASGLLALATAGKAGGFTVSNFGAEREVDGHQIIATLGDLLGRQLEVRTDPARLRPSDRPHLLSDCSLAHRRLGWQANPDLAVALEAALADPFGEGVAV